MTEEMYNDCRFSENEWCNIYPYTCDYGDYCSNNEECPIKEMIMKLKRLEQENKELKEKVKELDKMTGIFSARLCDKYRSALEEIREVLTDEYYVDTVKAIHKINEVLK